MSPYGYLRTYVYVHEVILWDLRDMSQQIEDVGPVFQG